MRADELSSGFPGIPLVLAVLIALPLVSRGVAPRAGAGPAAPSPAPPEVVADPDTSLVARLLDRVAEAPGARPTVLVALLPDPDASSLDWMYDAYLAAIRRALEQADYVADRQWFPSSTRKLAVVDELGRNDSIPESEARPGVLFFRRDGLRELVVVLTVGEVPTWGVHRVALREALRLAHGLQAPGTDVRVMGPSFSGSAPSLAAVLKSWRPERGPPPCITVVSGAATSPDNPARFRGDARCDGGRRPALAYSTTLHDDDALRRAVFDDVLAPLGIAPGQVALLVEGTAYGLQRRDGAAGGGGEAGAGPGGPLRVPFPLNIAALREEYDRNPVVERDAAIPAAPRAAPRLPLSLRSRPRETAPSRSLLTPATLDLVLADVVATLEDHDIRAVGIMASDVRDKLFLAELLHRRLSGIHLFTFEGNALLRRMDYAPSVRGMVVASTYPLLLEEQTWTGSGEQGDLIPFANEGSAGVFNATLSLLGMPERMRGYRTLARGEATLSSRPPVWLTVVGGDRVLPLKIHEPDATGLAEGPPAGPISARARRHGDANAAMGITLIFAALLSLALVVMLVGPASLPLPRLTRGRAGSPALTWGPATPTGATLALGTGAVVAGGLARGSGPGLLDPLRACSADVLPLAPSLLVVALTLGLGLVALLAAPARRRRRWMRREALSAGGTAALASLAPVAFLQSHPAAWNPATHACAPVVGSILAAALWVSGAVLLGSLVLGAQRRIRAAGPLWPATLSKWLGRRLPHLLALGLGVAAILYLRELASLMAADPRTFGLYRFRALSLDSGVTPLPVFFLSTLGVFVGLGWARDRQNLLEDRRPMSQADWRRLPPTPEGEGAPAWVASFRGAHDAMRDIDVRLSRVAVPVLVAFVPILVIVAWPYDVRTLESVALGEHAVSSYLLWGNLLIGFGILVAGTVQLLRLHRPLKRGLGHLARTPLAHAFDRLPLRLRSLGRLHLFDSPADDLGEGMASEGYRALSACMEGQPGKGDLDAALTEGDGRGSALVVLATELRRAWRDDPGLVWRFAMKPPPPGSAEGSSGDWRPLAEEVAAIEVARYVDWVLRHIRRTAILLLVTTLLTTVAMEVMPLAYHDVMTRWFMVLVGASVLVLLYVMGSLAHDDVLGRINGTPPGKLGWDRASLMNAGLFIALPVLMLLGTEVPPVGRALFSGVMALLRAFSGV